VCTGCMKFIVVTTISPFVNGGAEYLSASLIDALKAYGHEVDVCLLPFSSEYRSIMQETMAFRLLDLSGAGDRLIAIRPPSYVVRHHSKVIWFIHHHRQSFDLWGTPYQDVPSNPIGEGYREAFRSADNVALREARAVYANSRHMCGRLREFNAFDADVLYPPLRRDHGLFCAGYGDYILCPGRLIWHKRHRLCIDAMRFTGTPIRLVVAGPPDSEEELKQLQQAAEASGASGRITIIGRWIGESEKANLFANARAVAYVPYDEDSYGYVSLEAAQSRKAVVTCRDSGGLLELVQDEINGFISDPEPAALAAC